MGGNPLKQIEAEAKRTARRVGAEAERVGEDVLSTEWWEKTATSGLAAAGDVGTWAAYAVNPTFGLGMGAKKAQETYEAMTEAERAEALAEAEAATAKAEETRLMEEQKTAQQEQERMVSERAAEAETQAKERARRLGRGRRGLLYQGKATGVDKATVLGG